MPAASIAALYVNANHKEGAPPADIADFLVFRPPPTDDEEDAEMDDDIIEFMKRFKDPE